MQPARSAAMFTRILDPLTGLDRLREEKARLEAFLAAVPGEYCGFAPDGVAIYSDGFCSLLGLSQISTIHDIQGALGMSDAAALEGFFYRLQEDNKPFSIMLQPTGPQEKILRLRGSRGADLDGRDRFDILWLEDITEETQAQQTLQKLLSQAEGESARYAALLDLLPTPLWMRSSGGDLVWCNRAYAGLLDLSPAEVVAQQKELSLTSGRNRVTSRDMATAALKTGTAQSQRVHVITAGKRRLMTIAEAPLPTTSRTLGMALDTTREEELEKELGRFNTASEQLLEQLRTAIAIFAPDTSLNFFNSAFSQLWGLEDTWLNRKPRLSDLLEKLRENRRLPEQADFRKYKQGWLDMFTRLIDPHEDMLHLPDGSALRMLVVPHPMGGLMMTFEDVTSRLALESSYNTLIAVQKETLDNLAEGVAAFGGDGRLKLWNPSFAELWDFNPEDLDGEPHIAKMAVRMAQSFDEKDREAQKTALIGHGLERRIQDGRLARSNGMLLEYATVPLPDGGVLVSYFDVTDTVRVQTALEEKNAALEAAEQLKTDFLANVSYQLRTPLSTIMGFAEILDHQFFGTLNERQKEYTGGIHEAGQRLVSLIDDILDLSTIEAGYMDLHKEEIDIAALLRGLVDLTQDWARKQTLQVRLDIAADCGMASIDERRIKQILLGLIRNAINHSPEGGTVTLSASRRTEFVDIAVADTGRGIPAEEQARIFEPFQRVQGDSVAGARRGAGLGLSLVKSIAELHGGSVALSSAPGRGTTVTVSLPV